MSEHYWSPDVDSGDGITDATWTLTCPYRSTLTMGLRFVEPAPLAPDRIRYYVPWTIDGATGSFAGMRGNGIGVANVHATASGTAYDVVLNGSVVSG